MSPPQASFGLFFHVINYFIKIIRATNGLRYVTTLLLQLGRKLIL